MPSEKEITKLGLHLPTDPRWVDLASISLQDILTDHAYCEQKAASSGISLIQKYPDKTELVEKLSPVVAEEWEHFCLVINELKKRNLQLGFQRKDEYVIKLLEFQRKGGSREDRLIEHLLTFALIEARSCERFRLLSLHLEEHKLKEFYHHFMVSEAGHYRMFLDLAIRYSSEKTVRLRWNEYLEFEAKIMKLLLPRGDRMH